MPSGFQVLGDYGTLQIDSDFVNLALRRSGQVATANYQNGGVSTNPTRASVAVGADEIIAFSCSSAPAAIVGRENNTVTFSAAAGQGTVIRYWIFGGGTTSSSSGIQVFNADGGLSFDSSWRLFNVVGIVGGFGNSGLSPDRTYAALPSNMFVSIDYGSVVGGVQPSVFIIWSRVTRYSCIQISGATAVVSSAIVDQWAWQQNQPPFVTGPNSTDSNNVTPTYMIIDVTNYA